MPKKKKVAAKSAARRATKPVAARSKPAKGTTKRKPSPVAPAKRKPVQRKETPSQAALSRRRSVLGVTKPKPRKPAKKPQLTTRGRPAKPNAVAKAKAQLAKARARHEAASRAAATRRKAHSRLTSRTRRKTVARVDYQEIAWNAADILRGKNESNPHIRAEVDQAFDSLVGRDVQVSFGVVTYDDGEKTGTTRVRRVIRNYQGREDIANILNAAVREGMRQLGSTTELYITYISVQAYDE